MDVISQYTAPDFAVDVGAGFFRQSFKVGQDLIEEQVMTLALQASKRFPAGFAIMEPYACLWYNTFSMDVLHEGPVGS